MSALNENRPTWAAGLDLSPEVGRVSDHGLTEWVTLFQGNTHAVLRRLADTEMRVAQLEREVERLSRPCLPLAQIEDAYGPDLPGREPDFLIESDGSEWRLVDDQGRYARTDGSFPGFTPDRAKIERSSDGPVRAAWK